MEPEENATKSQPRRTYIHGIYEIMHSKRYTFWLYAFVLLLAMGRSISSCCRFVEIYWDEITITESTIQRRQSAALPHIGICPSARFYASRLDYLISTVPTLRNHSHVVRETLSIMFLGPNVFSYMKVYERLFELMKLREMGNGKQILLDIDNKLVLENGGNMLSFLSNVTFRCEDIIASCSIDIDSPMKPEQCCSNYKRFLNVLGFCPVVNSFVQKFTGLLSGLKVEVSIPKSEVEHRELLFPEIDAAEIVLLTPDLSLTAEYLHIQMETHASISLREVRSKKLNVKSGPCEHNTDSQQVCLVACVAEQRIKDVRSRRPECSNCMPVVMINFTKLQTPACPISVLVDCFTSALMTEMASGDNSVFSKCQRELCPIPCSFSYYEKSLSYSRLKPLENQSEELATRGRLFIDVAYSALDVKESREHLALNLFSLVAQIGGSLGLWMGASVMAIVQLLIVTANYLSWQCRRRRKRVAFKEMEEPVQEQKF